MPVTRLVTPGPDAAMQTLGICFTGCMLTRERRRLLVANVDHANAFLYARGFGQQHRAAHDVEEILDSLLLQTSGDDF